MSVKQNQETIKIVRASLSDAKDDIQNLKTEISFLKEQLGQDMKNLLDHIKSLDKRING